MIRCDASHSTRYTEGRPAMWDLGRYVRAVGIPGRVRYLCEDCARGLYLGKNARRLPGRDETGAVLR